MAEPGTGDGVGIDTVLLDAGGVLVLPHPAAVRAALAPHGITVDEAALERAHYLGAAGLASWFDADAEIWDAYDVPFLRALGVEDPPREVLLALSRVLGTSEGFSSPAPGASDALAGLVRAGVSVAIVSNADGNIEAILRRAGVCQVGDGPHPRVHAIVDSSVVGVAKPDPRIFEIALDAVGASSEGAVHVGDTVGADVEGARAAGVRPLHLDPFGLCAAGDHEHVSSLQDVVDLVSA